MAKTLEKLINELSDSDKMLVQLFIARLKETKLEKEKIDWKTARKKAGVNVNEAAELVGKTKATVYGWEKYITSPSFEDAEKLLKLYGREWDEIIFTMDTE